MQKKFMAILLVLCMLVAPMHMTVHAEETKMAKLIHSDETEEYFATVQEAMNAAETGELVVLLESTDETISAKGKAVALVYNEFGEPAYDVQCSTKLGKYNASIIGDLEDCILATQNSSVNTSEYYEKVKKIATLDQSGEKSNYFHYYLWKDVTLTQDLTLPSYGVGVDISTQSGTDDIVFDLNGHTIDQTAGAAGLNTWNNYPIISVYNTLTLKDSVGNGKLIGVSYGLNVCNQGTFIMEGGTISTRGQLYSTNYTSALRIQGGHAIINGGTITAAQDLNEDGSILSTIVAYSHGSDKAKLTINGGTIEIAPAANRIYDGIANASIYDYYGSPDYEAEVELYGGTYVEEPEEHYIEPGCIRLCVDEDNDIWTVYPTYQVEHYVENLDGTYTLKETDLGTGTVQSTSPSTLYAALGEEVTAEENDYTAEHYVYNAEKSTSSAKLTKPTVDEEENPVLFALEMYYDLEEVTVTFEAGEHGSIKEGETASGNYKYGTKFPEAPAVEADEHYEFEGWYLGDTKAEAFPETVEEEVTYTAHWTQISTDPSEVVPMKYAYQVKHYLEQEDGTYELEETEFPLYGDLGAEAEAEAKVYENYEYDAEASIFKGTVIAPTVGEDGEVELLTLKMYYNLIKVTPTPTETEAPQPTETEAPEPTPEVPKDPTDASLDVPTSMYTVSAGSTQPGNHPERAIDGDENSFWEVVWDIGNTDRSVFWYTVELSEAVELDAVRQLPRYGNDYATMGTANGFITGYRIETSMDGENWETAAEGTWALEEGWKIAEFDEPVTAKFVRLVATSTYADKGINTNLSIKEIRLVATSEIEAPQPTETETPQPTETETPQPTETEAPEPTEEVTPTETPEVKEDVTTIFDDVYEDWYTDYVQYVYDNGLMTGIKGTRHFEPNGNITKAQVAQVLYNMEGQPEAESKTVFKKLSDVYEAEWYADAVAWAYDTGVVTGDLVQMKFFPNDDVTREQLALMMYRYADYKDYDISATSDFAGLVNADKVADWSMHGVKWAVGTGLISGVEKDSVKDLAPQGTASRAQMAAILQRFCEYYKK